MHPRVFISLLLMFIFSGFTCWSGEPKQTGDTSENLRVSFGADKDLSVSAGTATQNKDISKPYITVKGLADGAQVDIQYTVSATGGPLARMGMGYRLDEGYTLTFHIKSAIMTKADGKSYPVAGRFISVTGNNKAAEFDTDNQGRTISLKSTSIANNRIRNIVAEFDFEATGSSAPAPQQAAPKAAKVVTKPKPAIAPPTIKADSLKLPRLFCDNMILQQQTKNTFWGWAIPGETITVKASWNSEATATANANGRWKLLLDTPKFGTGHTLTIAGKTDIIQINNVAIGEVWLCAGQSNMGWAMGNSYEAEKEADINLPDFRIFKSAREHWHTPLEMQRDRLSQWKPCDPDAAAETSAVSYYFGKKLHLELGIPVGIIQQAFAGTPIEGWMPWELQKEDPRARQHKAELDASAARQKSSGSTVEKALADFEKELAEYNAKLDAGETMKNSVKPLAPPIITKPAHLGHQYPAHMFNAMINPIIPYGIRGAIWYQGERNAKDVPQAFHYRNQLPQLIQYYRSTWHERSGGHVAADFPFQFTQLPSWTPPQTEPVEGLKAPWVISRESMLEVTKTVPNTGMSVAIDTGSATALHPKSKKPIGIRHAYIALKQTYGKNIVDYGPRFKRQTITGKQIVIEFESTGGGLMSAKPGKLDTFAIAGADQNWHWAHAEIKGNTVVVSLPTIPSPVAVRYAWGMNPSQRNLLYNKEGLPASPFRTDNWPLFDPDADVITIKKPAKPENKDESDWDRPIMTQ